MNHKGAEGFLFWILFFLNLVQFNTYLLTNYLFLALSALPNKDDMVSALNKSLKDIFLCLTSLPVEL